MLRQGCYSLIPHHSNLTSRFFFVLILKAERSESIMVGDLLVAVNDQPLSGLSKAEVCVCVQIL